MRTYGQFCPIARGSEILAERWTPITRRARRVRLWLLAEGGQAELCRFDPGFGDDLVVSIDDPLVFAHWHLGRVSWAAAVASGGVTVSGPRALRQALPTWNTGPEEHIRMRA